MAVAEEGTATTPKMELTPTSYSSVTYAIDGSFEVYPGGRYVMPSVTLFVNTNVTDPQGVVHEVRQDVSNLYSVYFYMTGKGDDDLTKDKDGKEITRDATGTSVQKLYGGITVGSKAGKVSVDIVAKPKDPTKYAELTQRVTFTIKPYTPVFSVSPNPLTIAVTKYNGWSNNALSQIVALPKLTVTDEASGIDISSHYILHYPATVPSGYAYSYSDTTQKNINGIAVIVPEKAQIDAFTAPAPGTLTFTIISKDATTYPVPEGSESVTIPLSARKVGSTEGLGVTMSIPASEFNSTFSDPINTEGEKPIPAVTVYKYSEKYNTTYNENAPLGIPQPVFKDENGNALDEVYSLYYSTIADHDVAERDSCASDYVTGSGATSPRDGLDVWEDDYHEKTLGTVNDAQFQTYRPGWQKVVVRAYQQNKGKYLTAQIPGIDNANFLCDKDGKILADTFYIRVLKRVPQVVLTPDPSTLKITKETEWSPQNRLEVSGYFYDKYTGETNYMTYGNGDLGKSNGFWYAFSFEKESGIVVTQWPWELSDRILVYYKDGTFKHANAMGYSSYEAFRDAVYNDNNVKAFKYISARQFGDDAFKLKFTKLGTAKFKYTILPWTHQKWDVGEKEFSVNVLDQTAVDVSIEPRIKRSCEGTRTIEGPQKSAFKVVNQVTGATKVGDTNLNEVYDYSYSVENHWVTGREYDGEVNSTIAKLDNGIYTVRDGWWREICTVNATTGEVVFTTAPANDADIKYVDIKVTAKPKSGYETQFASATTTYSVYLVYCGDGTTPYEIIDDTNNNNDAHTQSTIADETNENAADYGDNQQEGKLHFTGKGSLIGGTSITGMPGITVTLGGIDSNKQLANNMWPVDEVTTSAETTGIRTTNDYTYNKADGKWDNNTFEGTDKLYYTHSATVQIDANGFPTGGTYYVLRPVVNGFLFVDALWEKGETYMLIDRDLYGNIEKDYINPSENSCEARRFGFPLTAGYTYYMYKTSGDGIMRVHGIEYQPAFIVQRTDTKPNQSATAFLAGAGESYYTEAVPTLTWTGAEANFVIRDNNIVDEKQAVEVNSSGKVVINSVPVNNNGKVRITGVVKSSIDGIHKAPWFDLTVSDIPTYVTENGYKPSLNERITTTNHKTAIEMTFGGWDAEGAYRTFSKKTNIVEGKPIETITEKKYVDSWKTAKMDSVGRDGRTLDGFAYGSQGTQNGKDEKMDSYKGNGKSDTYNVPCRGTYLRFEPHEPGRLMVYIMQSGITDYSVANPDKSDAKIKLRPVYIIDESGNNVPLAESGTGELTNYTGHKSECKLRCPYPFDDKNPIMLNGSAVKFSWDKNCDTTSVFKIDANGNKVSDETETLAEALNTYWPGKKVEGNSDAEDIKAIQTADGGYLILTKAYMRYSFDVKPGKTYFITANGTKLFFDGFAFLPTGWTAAKAKEHDASIDSRKVTYEAQKGYSEGIDSEQKTLLYGNSDDNLTITNNGMAASSQAKANPSTHIMCAPSITDEGALTDNVTAKENTDVTFKRGFTAGSWTSICLPFSVGESQFKQVFGDDALIIGFDSIGSDPQGSNKMNKIYFTQHAYHMIEAGRPYFIKPTKSYTADNPVVFKNVTVTPNVQPQTITWTDPTNNVQYDFVGSYSPVVLPENDIVLVGDKIWILAGNYHQGGYRAYIHPHDPAAGAKISGIGFGDVYNQMQWVDDEGETTGIKKITTDNYIDDGGTIKGGIFDLSGRKVSDGKEGIPSDLAKGVYIINGKKYVIK